ncbi:hypothetical protein [Streptomyces gilvus]|uniref:hypothetical protein n=1 Tax=Streptomyces gilvus TaxID=2920937 RepID=UPI001F0DDB21|nr:hypothetical protein [Streptomyces sp. CME 23]MCH5672049.1 hypothetical protein [Streptomyces sp. CME 23]
MVLVTATLQLLILAGMLYDTARLLAPDARHPSRRRRERAERRLVRRRLNGRIDAVTYRARMHALAGDEGMPRPGRRA